MPEWRRLLAMKGTIFFSNDFPIGINPKVYKGNTEAVLKEFQARSTRSSDTIRCPCRPPVSMVHESFSRKFFPGRVHWIRRPFARPPSKSTSPGKYNVRLWVKFAPPEPPAGRSEPQSPPRFNAVAGEKDVGRYPQDFAVREQLLPFPPGKREARASPNS